LYPKRVKFCKEAGRDVVTLGAHSTPCMFS